ncbi:hypothetical protein B0H14DRAFT_2558024 [Mycena olivaceomarginata]|nr:hypothetical protein B0H14DRAFT_2558024 [Mycena olivaceomarginata]
MEHGQFSVATEDQSDNGIALDTDLHDGLDTDRVSNFTLPGIPVDALLLNVFYHSTQGHSMADHDSGFNFHSSAQVFSTTMEDNVGMFGPFHSSKNGSNESDPTYDALMFNTQFDGPKSRRDLSMDTNHFSPAGTDEMDSLPLLPMPASTPPSVESSTLSIEPEIQLPSKKWMREPEVNQANIIEGSCLRNKSCRALGEA